MILSQHHQPSSYVVTGTGEERFGGVPKQGGSDLRSPDLLPLRTVYSAAGDRAVVYRSEVNRSTMAVGELKPAGGVPGTMQGTKHHAKNGSCGPLAITFRIERELEHPRP